MKYKKMILILISLLIMFLSACYAETDYSELSPAKIRFGYGEDGKEGMYFLVNYIEATLSSCDIFYEFSYHEGLDYIEPNDKIKLEHIADIPYEDLQKSLYLFNSSEVYDWGESEYWADDWVLPSEQGGNAKPEFWFIEITFTNGATKYIKGRGITPGKGYLFERCLQYAVLYEYYLDWNLLFEKLPH